jgi:hypothetical protein
MNGMRVCLLFISLIVRSISVAQTSPVQTVRGVVIERSIGTPLPGATITLPGLGKAITADSIGRFRFDAIPVGRVVLLVSHAGYLPVTLSNLMIDAGKEAVLTIEMEEIAVRVREIVIKGRPDKSVRGRIE